MVPLKKSTRQSLIALLCCAAVMPPAVAASADTAPGVAHPARGPRAHSVGLLDAATESLVTELMSRMSPEQKVGQIIQLIEPDGVGLGLGAVNSADRT